MLLLAVFILISTKTMAQFTQHEKELINNGIAEDPMRVLLVTNENDYHILRQKSTEIKDIPGNNDLHLLIDRLKITLDVESGVGISAVQVGVLKNLFLFVRIDKPGYPIQVAINPRIMKHPEKTICFEDDGCLSIPRTSGNSQRYPWIEVEYTDEKGELIHERLEGYSRDGNFTAVIFQHEYDHLQGVLFIDKLCIDSKKME